MKEKKMIGRIRYEENWMGEGEHFIYEWRWEDEDEWQFEASAPLCSWENGNLVTGKGDFLNYSALTHIRKWTNLGFKHIYMV